MYQGFSKGFLPSGPTAVIYDDLLSNSVCDGQVQNGICNTSQSHEACPIVQEGEQEMNSSERRARNE